MSMFGSMGGMQNAVGSIGQSYAKSSGGLFGTGMSGGQIGQMLGQMGGGKQEDPIPQPPPLMQPMQMPSHNPQMMVRPGAPGHWDQTLQGLFANSQFRRR